MARQTTKKKRLTVRDICRAVDELAPPALAYEWDRVGLNVGDPSNAVDCVVVALTVTPEAVAVAVKARAQLMVVHHPPIWEPLKSLRTDEPATRLMLEVAQAGISIYSAHTNLDVAPGGVNDILARRLCLTQVSPLFPCAHAGQVKLVTFVPESHLPQVRDAVCSAGAGVIGEYSHCSFSTAGTGTFLPGKGASPFSGEKGKVNEEAERRFEVLAPKARLAGILQALNESHPYEEVAYDLISLENADPRIGLGRRGKLREPMVVAAFVRHVCNKLNVSYARVVGALKGKVQDVAVLGGSGGGEISRLPEGVDIYVTGDVKYHDALIALEKGIIVVDAGHGGTEKHLTGVVARYLKSRFNGLRVKDYVEPELFQTEER
ncbi:MAG: Nif3-like dinuclear metal center hexameric protein [Candidatus Hydrogenedentes bacterium]|nr:Nif3-like dinuclear metal center hexameric protein [Candidatus Hydrogenedentota bacterium]